MKKAIAILIISSVVAGCAHSPGTNNPASPDQQAMTEGCVGGGLLGAALGAGMGALLGGGQGAAIGAGAGALAGTAGGCAYANNVTNQHAQLTGKENDLNAQIQYATTLAETAKVHNQQLAKEINEATLKVAQIKKDINRKKATQGQLAEQKHLVGKMLADEQKNETQLSSTIAGLQTFRTKQPQKSQVLDEKITELQAQLQTLKKSNQALAKISQRI